MTVDFDLICATMEALERCKADGTVQNWSFEHRLLDARICVVWTVDGFELQCHGGTLADACRELKRELRVDDFYRVPAAKC